MDVDGDMAKLADEIAEVVERLEPNGDIDRAKIAQLLAASGVGNLQALGLSSYEDGALFHNRAYLKFEGPRGGLMKVAGGAPHAFEALELAPADSDIVIEQDLYLTQAFKVVLSTIATFEPNMAKEIEEEIARPISGLAMTGIDIVNAADTRLLMIGKLDSKRRIDLRDLSPGAELPHIDFAIALDGYGFVIDKVADQYGQAGMFDVSRDKDLLVLTSCSSDASFSSGVQTCASSAERAHVDCQYAGLPRRDLGDGREAQCRCVLERCIERIANFRKRYELRLGRVLFGSPSSRKAGGEQRRRRRDHRGADQLLCA